MNNRLEAFRTIVLIVFCGVLFRLFFWQILKSSQLKLEASAQYNRVSILPVSRGKIFTADGYPIAMNQRVYTLFVLPKKISDSPPHIANLLSPILFDQVARASGSATPTIDALQSQLVGKIADTSKSWVALRHDVSKDEYDSIQNLQIPGLGFDPDETRYYPEASMAANLLGFVGNDESGSPKGYFGIEGKYDLELKGKGGYVAQQTDALGKPIAIGDFAQVESVAARDLKLT